MNKNEALKLRAAMLVQHEQTVNQDLLRAEASGRLVHCDFMGDGCCGCIMGFVKVSGGNVVTVYNECLSVTGIPQSGVTSRGIIRIIVALSPQKE